MLTTVLFLTTITVTPSDSFDKIENAQPGDEVVIAPGTYHFRVYLNKQGTMPILIRAQDPSNPPVWDMGSTLVEDAPGSSTAGDRGRGCWQLVGATNYVIDSIVFTHCRNVDNNSAGIRYFNGVHNLLIRNCVFRENDNGITGGNGGSDAIVEFSEFDRNGNLAASAPTHNMYIYGGTFNLRYSYVHDPVQAQNFHIRAEHATIEYNWFARGKSYEGDLMTDDDFVAGGGPYSQEMILRGNVIVQNQTPDNTSQIVALYNDTGVTNLTLAVTMLNNTVVGNGGNAAAVHLSNADGTMMGATITNNILFGTTRAVVGEIPGASNIVGRTNWMATGADDGGLASTVFSAMPGFVDAANKNFRLASGSASIGHGTVAPFPNGTAVIKEYYRDETVTRMYRVRATLNDIGAFESTTVGPGIGPGGAPPGDGGAGSGGTGGSGGTVGTGGTSGTMPQGNAESGCGCSVGGAPRSIAGLVFLMAWIIARPWRCRSRSRRSRSTPDLSRCPPRRRQ